MNYQSPVLIAKVYLLWILVIVNSKDIIRTVTRFPYAPEPKAVLSTPDRNSKQWEDLKEGAEHVGLLFAGRNELTWIVDIRVDNLDQELWAIGNIITSKKVLTTCRASKILQDHWSAKDDTRIRFGTQYLWEKHVRKAAGGDLFDSLGISGKRLVSSIMLHPKCSLSVTVMWDTSIITLQTDIVPFLPGVGFVYFSTVNPIIARVSLELRAKQRQLCYVGSYGKNYLNWKKDKVVDYKVKYRVYRTDWEVCSSAINFMCGQKVEESCKIENYKKEEAKQLLCFETRAKVGSVCDHDRGAPIICDDEFVGMVTRGADFQHCNNLLHLPFFALNRNNFSEYFSGFFDASQNIVGMRSLSDTQDAGGSLIISLLINLLFSIFFME